MIAGALFGCSLAFGSGLVDALFDVARLLGDFANNTARIRVKNAIAVYVTDVANGFADSLDVIELGIACDLAREDDEIAFRKSFTGDAAERILFEAGVENVVANCVADFIGMTFGDGLGGEDIATRHNKQ